MPCPADAVELPIQFFAALRGVVAGTGARLSWPFSGPCCTDQGACLLWLNPKGWAMALGAAASFATLASGPLQLAVLLGSAFGLAAATSLSLWRLAGLLLARLLRTERQWRVLNAMLGLLLAVSIIPMWSE